MFGSAEPFPEDVEQRRGGLLVESQYAAVSDVRVEHDDPVLFGHEQVGEACRAVCLTRFRE